MKGSQIIAWYCTQRIANTVCLASCVTLMLAAGALNAETVRVELDETLELVDEDIAPGDTLRVELTGWYCGDLGEYQTRSLTVLEASARIAGLAQARAQDDLLASRPLTRRDIVAQ